jgi:phosphoglycolate phosphatase-like HAD superfamily hydrolase
MPLRIGFDMDGVLADFSQAFHDVEVRLFGAESRTGAGEPGREEENQETNARRAEEAGARERARAVQEDLAGLDDYESENIPIVVNSVGSRRAPVGESRRRRDVVWQTIQATSNFWVTLRPIDPAAVSRIHQMMLSHGWEVFFITQRPKTDGETVQRQTQRWLVVQGFDLPSVLVLAGSRGAAAGALRLDYLVDDSAQNCLDVLADSRARPLLIVPDEDGPTIASARKLGIGTARSIGDCLDILEKATVARRQPGLLQRLSSFVGWR